MKKTDIHLQCRMFFIWIGITFISMIVSFWGVLIFGTFIGNFINSVSHNHYECICDYMPVLSLQRAIVFGILSYILILTCLYFIINRMHLHRNMYFKMMILISILNGLVITIVVYILSAQVSG